MTVENMTFLGEEIIVKKEKTQTASEVSVFNNSGMTHEKDSLAKFRVVKVGKKQTEVKTDDILLINQNGLGKEITIDGIGVITDHYALMNHLRIFCIVNE